MYKGVSLLHFSLTDSSFSVGSPGCIFVLGNTGSYSPQVYYHSCRDQYQTQPPHLFQLDLYVRELPLRILMKLVSILAAKINSEKSLQLHFEKMMAHFMFKQFPCRFSVVTICRMMDVRLSGLSGCI